MSDEQKYITSTPISKRFSRIFVGCFGKGLMYGPVSFNHDNLF
jgi:hypothetical protein